MANVNLLPGYGFIQESGTNKVNLAAGYGFVHETNVTPTPPTPTVTGYPPTLALMGVG